MTVVVIAGNNVCEVFSVSSSVVVCVNADY